MSHEHGGGEEAIRREVLETTAYEEQRLSRFSRHIMDQIVNKEDELCIQNSLSKLEEQEEVLAPGITYEQTNREYKRLLTYSEDILNLRLGVIDSKLKDNNNKTLSLETDRNRLLNERLLVLNVLNEKFWGGK